ncbi:MAG: selenium cofactor biosynthesis protein YqeC [Lachnospiraceae bacterium]|nr:selenium cofactor biosynthesis protein YqeC [Lachnospiraceae bacterium]
MNEESLFTLPKGSVLYVCGAGGKTTLIHKLRDAARSEKKSVMVTTTTHMLREDPMCADREEIISARKQCGYVFAAMQDPENVQKCIGIQPDLFCETAGSFDLTLVEADGSRRLPFKMPYEWEPVIRENVTAIALVAGMRAVGEKLRTAAYGAELICSRFSLSEDATLTPELMARIYLSTYVERFRKEYPQVPVTLVASQTDSEERAEYGRRFLKEAGVL